MSKEEPRRVSPLFNDTVDPEGTKYIYADEIREIRLSRLTKGIGGKVRRMPIPREEWEEEDTGEDFAIDPFETTGDDIMAQFGGGEYYVEPIAHDGKLMPGGHALVFPRTRRDRDDSRDEGDEDRVNPYGMDPRGIPGSPHYDPRFDPRAMMPGMPGFTPFQAPAHADGEVLKQLLTTMQTQMNQRTEAAEAAGGKRDDLVRDLKEQLEALRTNHRVELDRKSTEMEEMRRRCGSDLDAERSRARKEVDDARDEYSSKRRSLEQEIQRIQMSYDERLKQERENYRHDLDEARRRSDRELQDERDRRKNDTEDTKARNQTVRSEQEKTIADLRKQVADMTREMIDLRRDLADRSEPEAPVRSAEAPWWVGTIEKALPVAARVVQQAQQAAQAQAAAQVAAQQQHQPIPLPQSFPQAPQPFAGLDQIPPPLAPAPVPMPSPMVPAAQQQGGRVVQVQFPQAQQGTARHAAPAPVAQPPLPMPTPSPVPPPAAAAAPRVVLNPVPIRVNTDATARGHEHDPVIAAPTPPAVTPTEAVIQPVAQDTSNAPELQGALFQYGPSITFDTDITTTTTEPESDTDADAGEEEDPEQEPTWGAEAAQ